METMLAARRCRQDGDGESALDLEIAVTRAG